MSDARAVLLAVLIEAASQDQDRMRNAVSQLQQWEITPQFHATLQDIFYDKTLDTNVRWQAIIYLKNGIDKYWRKTAKNGIAPEEKAAIRSRLLTALDEEQKPLATQNGVLTAKIARFDFPTEWPELLTTLLHIIQTSAANESDPRSRLILQRSLYTLHLVVKGLISKTLAAGRRQFAQVAPELFSNLSAIYQRYMDAFLASITSSMNIEHMSACLETSLLALKCLRRVIVHGFTDVHLAEGPRAFLALALNHLQQFVAFKENIPDSCSFLQSSVEAHIKLFGKFYLDFMESHPRQFILTPSASRVLGYYWKLLSENGEAGISHAPTTLIQGMLLIKKTLKDPQFILNDKDPEPVVVQCRHIIENEFMTPETTAKLAEILITKYMRLTEDDMDQWDSDPEGWALEEEADSWRYQLRPCAEKVFMDLLSSHRTQLSPLLVQLAGTTATMTDVFLKDSIYTAIGLGSHELYNAVDFDGWLAGQLTQEVQNADPSNRIIRRRIAWMIGRWVNVNISKTSRPTVYGMLLHLMRAEEPLAVRLAAAMNQKVCIDDWDFEASSFAPFLEASVHALRQLMGEVEEADSRMKILSAMSMIVERMDEHIAPFAQQIIELLPPLWDAAGDQNLLQSAILVIMTKLVESLKSQSLGLHALVMPLIRMSVDPSQPAHVYLMEDGLELWLATLKSAQQATEELLSLAPAAVTLLSQGMDNMKMLLKILNSYMLLAPAATMQRIQEPLLQSLTAFVGELKPEATMAVMHFMDAMAVTCPLVADTANSNHHSSSGTLMMGDAYRRSGLLRKLVQTILAKKEPNVVMTQYLSFMARLAVDNAEYLGAALMEIGQQFGQSNLKAVFYDFWLEKFDNISHPKYRKLHAMGLTAFMQTTDPTILENLPRLVAIWGDVLNEVSESGDGDALVYWRQDGADDDGDDVGGSATLGENGEVIEEIAETLRRRELLRRDLVHTTNLATYIKKAIQHYGTLNGGPEAFQQQWLVKVDPLMLESLHPFLANA
ncbi:hypothetical protein DFQ27_002603 [Actinomortierella ambigua]|uniref:Importin N-terminal domain-containing protein n=1 Tax=Actinomortierella ambigua TaxID=1343610 RepID=A0A9P6QJM5_9FUNG|nr:hypothetical protein DFQ26_001611 [Actinomortierella ambigua]KAG0270612.1 hypothetical protein DFQ27_002603 [Actinomortierella ambigua]